MSFLKKDRKIQSFSGKTFPANGGNGNVLGANEFASTIAAALRQHYGDTHAALKTIAALTGANERAVRNWFEGRNGPSGAHLVALVRHSDAVHDAFLLMAGRGHSLAAKKLIDARETLVGMLEVIVGLTN